MTGGGLELPLTLVRARNFLLALDGKLAGKTHRLIASSLSTSTAPARSCGAGPVVCSRISRYRANAIIGFVCLRVNCPARCLHMCLNVQRTLPTMCASWARHV